MKLQIEMLFLSEPLNLNSRITKYNLDRYRKAKDAYI